MVSWIRQFCLHFSNSWKIFFLKICRKEPNIIIDYIEDKWLVNTLIWCSLGDTISKIPSQVYWKRSLTSQDGSAGMQTSCAATRSPMLSSNLNLWSLTSMYLILHRWDMEAGIRADPTFVSNWLCFKQISAGGEANSPGSKLHKSKKKLN